MTDIKKQFFSPGWYRIGLRLQSMCAISASLLLKYDDSACHQEATIMLYPIRGTDRIEQVLMFAYPVRHLQLKLKPDNLVSESSMTGVDLVKLNRFSALWCIFLGLFRNGKRSPLATPTEAIKFVVNVFKCGFRGAARLLYSRYQDSCLGIRNRHDYERWVDLYDANFYAHSNQEMTNGERLISILLPIDNCCEQSLRRCVSSVYAQIWKCWELCVVVDPANISQQWLQSVVNKDSRVRISFKKDSGSMAGLSNAALEMASGEFIIMLDADAKLRPDALLEIGDALKNDDLDFIYSDEDQIDVTGKRCNPYFKPDWNPDLLLSQNYIGYLTAIRRTLVMDAGGVNADDENSSYHSLFLRCTGMIGQKRILHIPKVLCHRRLDNNFDIKTMMKGGHEYIASMHAVSNYLSALCPEAKVFPTLHFGYRVKWPLPKNPPHVSLVIPTRDQVVLLKNCIESILEKTSYPNYDIIIVDNDSRETDTLHYFERLQELSIIKIIKFDSPFNYSMMNNIAVVKTDAEIIGLVNNDVEVISEDWLDEMVGHAIRPGVGAVGAKLYYPDDTIQHAGVVFLLGGVDHIYRGMPGNHAGHGGRMRCVQNFSAVTAACLVIKRELYLECGGLNEENLAVSFNDVDFCLRLLNLGYRHVWTPFAELYHHESASRGADDTVEKKERSNSEINYVRSIWRNILNDDPAYNPNLSINDLDSALAFPPRARVRN